jgi:hypothetical protein
VGSGDQQCSTRSLFHLHDVPNLLRRQRGERLSWGSRHIVARFADFLHNVFQFVERLVPELGGQRPLGLSYPPILVVVTSDVTPRQSLEALSDGALGGTRTPDPYIRSRVLIEMNHNRMS